MGLGERLRIAREDKGVSQTQVHKDTGINNKTLSGYERNISEPDVKTLELLSSYYNVSVDYLLGITDIKNIGQTQAKNPTLEKIEGLSEESKKELDKYIEFLKIKEQMDKSKDETSSALEKKA